MSEKTPVPIGEVTSFRRELANRPGIPAQRRLLKKVDTILVARAGDFHDLQRRRVSELESPPDLSQGIELWSYALREIPGLYEALNAGGEKAAAPQEQAKPKPYSIDIARIPPNLKYGREPYTSMHSYVIAHKGGILIFKGVLGRLAELMDRVDRDGIEVHVDTLRRELGIEGYTPLISAFREHLIPTGVQLLSDRRKKGRGYFWGVPPPGVKMNAGTTEEWDINSRPSSQPISMEPGKEISLAAAVPTDMQPDAVITSVAEPAISPQASAVNAKDGLVTKETDATIPVEDTDGHASPIFVAGEEPTGTVFPSPPQSREGQGLVIEVPFILPDLPDAEPKPYALAICRVSPNSKYADEPYSSMPPRVIKYEGGEVILVGVYAAIANALDESALGTKVTGNYIAKKLGMPTGTVGVFIGRIKQAIEPSMLALSSRGGRSSNGYSWGPQPGVTMNAEPSAETPLAIDSLTNESLRETGGTIERPHGPIPTPEEIMDMARAVAELLTPCTLDQGATLAGLRSILSPRLVRALDPEVVQGLVDVYIPQPDNEGIYSPEAITTLLCLFSRWKDGEIFDPTELRRLPDYVHDVIAEREIAKAPDKKVAVDLHAPILYPNISAAESLSQLLDGPLSTMDQRYLLIKLRYLSRMKNDQIGEEVGIPTNNVSFYLGKIRSNEGLPQREGLQKQLLTELIATNTPDQELADILEIGVKHLAWVIIQYGLREPRASITEALTKRDRDVAEFYMRGYSISAIKQELDLTAYQVKASLGRKGLYSSRPKKR